MSETTLGEAPAYNIEIETSEAWEEEGLKAEEIEAEDTPRMEESNREDEVTSKAERGILFGKDTKKGTGATEEYREVVGTEDDTGEGEGKSPDEEGESKRDVVRDGPTVGRGALGTQNRDSSTFVGAGPSILENLHHPLS